MGIRFQCPNGHQLNVKSYLAGKRGICPECGARFLVPVVSEEPATADFAQTKAAPTAATTPPSITSNRQPSDSTSVWYLRNEADQQFGPVDNSVIRQWLAEDRVAAQSWVWRTGWPQWQRADEAFAELIHRPPVLTPEPTASKLASASTPPPNPASAFPPLPQSVAVPEQDPSLTVQAPVKQPEPPSIAHRKRMGQRKKRRVQITLFLTLAVAILFVGLLIVVLK